MTFLIIALISVGVLYPIRCKEGNGMDEESRLIAIKELQLIGYLKGNGNNATELAIAVKRFQNSIRLPETGILDSATLDNLRDMRRYPKSVKIREKIYSDFPFASESTNVALGKPVLGSAAGAIRLTDGDGRTCLGPSRSVAVNLEKSYRIEKIRIKSNGMFVHKVFVDNKYHACSSELSAKFCFEPGKLDYRTEDESQCENGPVTAQYIIISAYTDGSSLCEIEVFGSEVSGVKPDTRPELPDELPNLSSLTIGARNVILNGIQKLRLPTNSTVVTYYKRTSEAIMWTHDQGKYVVMVASEVSKGKLITCGNHEFIRLIYTSNEYATLRQNLNQWFNVSASKKYNEIEDNSNNTISDGDIIFIQSIRQLDPGYVAQILDRLKSGRNPVIIAGVYPKLQVNKSLQPIFNKAGVSITQEIANRDDVILIPAQYRNDNSTLPVEIAIDIFQKSISFFTENGNSMLRSASRLPSNDLRALTPGLTSLRDKYHRLMDWLIPCSSSPIRDQKEKNIIAIYNRLVLSQVFEGSGYKVPFVSTFPGDIPSTATLISVKVRIISDNSGEFHPTGYYLPPGGTMQWEIVEMSGKSEDWAVRIGCHTDDNTNLESRFARGDFVRFPIISNEVPLSAGRIYSPFGGVVWIKNNREKVSITLTLRNVVEAPFFNLRDPKSIANWNTRRNAPAPWAELAGDMMIFCVESKHVRNWDVEYVRNLMENTWDRMVKMDIDLKGKDWRNERRERTTTDVPLMSALAHAGYPIRINLNLVNGILNKVSRPLYAWWAMCQEISNNMQESYWISGRTKETTNILMCLYNYEKLWNISISEIYNDPSKADPIVSLRLYAQLATHFGFGLYHEVFKLHSNGTLNPKNDNDNWSTWLQTTSSVANLNLSPLFDFWGFSYSDEARREVSKLPCFFPRKDLQVETSTMEAAKIRAKYPNCVETGSKIGGNGPWNLAAGVKDNDVVVL